MLSLWRIVITLAAVLSFTAFVHSDTITVPDDHPTIQGAIDAAMNGDTVLVKPDTYVENIDFKGKAITVMGEQGAANTFIDGNQAGSVVICNNGEGLDSVLDGFTITNGDGWGGGGGMTNNGSSPTVTHCTFTGNWSSYGGGGGMRNSYSSPTVTKCVFIENGAGGYGGGMYNENSSPTVTQCTFFMNYASGPGGAHYGGGMFDAQSNTRVVNCTFINNFSLPNAPGNPSYGGGMFISAGSFPTVTNTVFWDNHSPCGPEIYIGKTLTISYSDVKGGQSSVYVEPGCTLNWGPGMIDSDPLFVDEANGDFHLTFLSPCRASGDNTAVTELYDFEGDPRIAYGTVDIGADEFYRHLYCMGDFTPGGAIEGKFIGLPGTTPVGLFLSAGTLPSPMPTMWGNFHLQFPVYLVELGPIPADGVMVLPTTLPGSIPAPYDVPMQALIGLNADSLSNLCVLEVR